MTPAEIIQAAIDRHSPAHIFGLFSGGDDSLTVTHFAAKTLRERLSGVVHINTGIGLPETRAHVDVVCTQLGWRLLEYKAKDQGQDYEQLVLEQGFPGPPQHTKMFNRLKERCIRALVRDHQGGDVMLVSGLRQSESVKRMRLKSEPIQRYGRQLWVAPFFFMSNHEVEEYRQKHLAQLPRNPAKPTLCMSGECLCGAFARPQELEEIEFFFPATGKYLRDLSARVRAAGFPWDWDERPPQWWVDQQQAKRAGQADAFEYELAERINMLCSSCERRHERNIELGVA